MNIRNRIIGVSLWIAVGVVVPACDNDAGDRGFSKATGNGASTVTTDTRDDTSTPQADGTTDTTHDATGTSDFGSQSDGGVDTAATDAGAEDLSQPQDTGPTFDASDPGPDGQGNDTAAVDTGGPNDAEPSDLGPGTDTTTILGGGVHYGECLDLCKFDLSFTQNAANLEVSSTADELKYANGGVLTTVGLQQLQEAANGLLGVEIQDVYDCPGCNDGGASYLILLLDNVPITTQYQDDKVPTELKNADTMVRLIMEALKTCKSNVQVAVDENCTPLPLSL